MKPDVRPAASAPAVNKKGAEYFFHRQQMNGGRTTPVDPPPRHLHETLRHAAVIVASMLGFLLVVLFLSAQTWQLRQEIHKRRIARQKEPEASTTSVEQKRQEAAELVAQLTPSETKLMEEATLLSRRATVLMETGQWEQAAQLFNEALRLWPGLNSARMALGRIYLRQRAFDRAAPYLEAALEREPDSAPLLNDLAVVYFFQRKITRALELLEAAETSAPDYAPLFFNRALIQLWQSNPTAARAALNRFLELAPQNPKGLKELAYLEALEGRYAEAYELLKQAIQQKPDWAVLHLDAAAVAALRNEPTTAWKHLEDATTLAPPQVVLRNFKAPAFWELRQTEKGQAFERRLLAQPKRPLPEGGELLWDAFSNEPLLSAMFEASAESSNRSN